MLYSIFQVSERHRVKEAVVGEETKFDKEIKERMRKEGLNFHPGVTEFTDICTRIRLAISHCFSATLSLLSIPETYSSSYICCRMKPFTVFRVAKDKGWKKNWKANWIECVEFEWCLHDSLQPCMSSKFFYIVCILIEELTRGSGKWHVKSDSFELSTCHLHHIQT